MHEIFSADKYVNAKKKQKKKQMVFSHLSAEKCSCSAMFSKKDFALVSNLRFISRKISRTHELIITSGPEYAITFRIYTLNFVHINSLPQLS